MKGKYTLKIGLNDQIKDSIWLNIKNISYKNSSIRVPFKNKIINFNLVPEVQMIEEVDLISNKTVEIKGDTIIYNVENLKKKKITQSKMSLVEYQV